MRRERGAKATGNEAGRRQEPNVDGSAPAPTSKRSNVQHETLLSLQRTAGNRAAIAFVRQWRRESRDAVVPTRSPGAMPVEASSGKHALLQRSFEYKNKEYYSAAEVTDKTAVYKDLVNEPGLFDAAKALAASADTHQVFKTRGEMVSYLKEHHSAAIDEALTKGAEDDEELADTLLVLGGEQGVPKGWGHTFSNGRHGDDMWRQPKLAQERAKREKKEAIGVWVNNDKAKTLIATSFGRVGGKDSVYIEDVRGMPVSVGVEITQDGTVRACRGFFMKIQRGIVISAYPTNKSKVDDDDDV
jgi:hypothetical protein